jgi:hypothetical protein
MPPSAACETEQRPRAGSESRSVSREGPVPSLRVAVVAPPWYEIPPDAYGGIESICYLLVEGLVARGHDVTLVGVDEPRTRARFMRTYRRAQAGRIGQSFPEVVHAAAVARACTTTRWPGRCWRLVGRGLRS